MRMQIMKITCEVASPKPTADEMALQHGLRPQLEALIDAAGEQ